MSTIKQELGEAINMKIVIIEEAIKLIEEAREMVDEVMSDGHPRDKEHYEAYGKYGFDQLLGIGNPYDQSLFTLMGQIKEKGE